MISFINRQVTIGNNGFVWNIMDRQTRFLIASKLTEDRDAGSAVKAFKEAIQNAHGIHPNKIFTDNLRSYNVAIDKTFDKYVHQIAKCGINKPNATNNRIERLNGTLRERVKVQRGWKTPKTPLAEGMRIQYNFVKPHMALDDETPAQRARIEVAKGGNKWMNLLEFSMNKWKSAKNV